LIKQVKLARFERLSLAAGLEAEREDLTEEELEAEKWFLRAGETSPRDLNPSGRFWL
jgi:hypothetical protein